MDLILHAGTHKTATTTFQAICADRRAALALDGLCYPAYRTWNQHSFAAWDLQARDDAATLAFLRDCHAQARAGGCHTVLLSGEDFENGLVDTNMARTFQHLAEEAGFARVRWVVVQRDPFDYLMSIYAEKSRYGATLSLKVIGETILKYGFFSLSTRNYNYRFVFDMARFAPLFRAEVSPALDILPFQDFKDDFVGAALLRPLVSDATLALLRRTAADQGARNTRLSREMVERLYACNFLGTTPRSGYSQRRSNLFRHLIDTRLTQVAEQQESLRAAFATCFAPAQATGPRPAEQGDSPASPPDARLDSLLGRR